MGSKNTEEEGLLSQNSFLLSSRAGTRGLEGGMGPGCFFYDGSNCISS